MEDHFDLIFLWDILGQFVPNGLDWTTVGIATFKKTGQLSPLLDN